MDLFAADLRYPTYDENYLHGDLALLQFEVSLTLRQIISLNLDITVDYPLKYTMFFEIDAYNTYLSFADPIREIL